MGQTGLSVSGFMPDLELASADGAPVRLRTLSGNTTVLVAFHSPDCTGCREYVNALAASSDEFEAWDARLLVVLPGWPAAPLRIPFGHVLIDERRLIAPGTMASVIVADRYSQIFHAVVAGASHDLPPPRELDEWLKFLGTLCPE